MRRRIWNSSTVARSAVVSFALSFPALHLGEQLAGADLGA
jgi:hypothetical protein